MNANYPLVLETGIRRMGEDRHERSGEITGVRRRSAGHHRRDTVVWLRQGLAGPVAGRYSLYEGKFLVLFSSGDVPGVEYYYHDHPPAVQKVAGFRNSPCQKERPIFK